MMSNVPPEYTVLSTNKPLVSTSHQGSASASPDYYHGNSNWGSYHYCHYGYYGDYHSQRHHSAHSQDYATRFQGYPNYYHGGYHDYYQEVQKDHYQVGHTKYCYDGHTNPFHEGSTTYRQARSASYGYHGYAHHHNGEGYATNQGLSKMPTIPMVPMNKKASSLMANTTSGSTKVPTTMISPSVRVPWQGGSVNQGAKTISATYHQGDHLNSYHKGHNIHRHEGHATHREGYAHQGVSKLSTNPLLTTNNKGHPLMKIITLLAKSVDASRLTNDDISTPVTTCNSSVNQASDSLEHLQRGPTNFGICDKKQSSAVQRTDGCGLVESSRVQRK
jgi:hypothetical protein